MITATIGIVPFAICVGIGLGLALLSDLRSWRRDRRRQLDDRRKLWAQLRARGYTVIPYRQVGLYGSLLTDDPWNTVLGQMELAQSGPVREQV